ncbi:MAG: regulatory protein GemA [bacterium]
MNHQNQKRKPRQHHQKTEDKTFCSKAQLALLHVAKQELRLDDDTYRDMLQNVAGVSSAADLPRSRFGAVLDHLKACGFEIRKKEGSAAAKKYDEYAGRAGMATPAQLRYIEWMFVQYIQLKGQPIDDRDVVAFGLRHYLKKFYKAEDLRFLTLKRASDAIEGLKNTLIHEREKQARKSVGSVESVESGQWPVVSGQQKQPQEQPQEERNVQQEQEQRQIKGTARPAGQPGPNLRRVF